MTATASPVRPLIVTGANASHFANLTVMLGSWRTFHPEIPCVICDYGLSAEQAAVVRSLPNVTLTPAPASGLSHAWEGKARLGEYLEPLPISWNTLIWIDADALFLRKLPPLDGILAGYDILLDAHVQSVGEIMHECNRVLLEARPDDAYFSSGFWIVRRGCLLESFARGCALVKGKGNLWENDAFVAAIYRERLRVRTVSGGVWHARGKTSLHTCEVRQLEAFHAGQPILVLHANDGYSVRADGRRVFKRPELAAIQDHYEEQFWRGLAPEFARLRR